MITYCISKQSIVAVFEPLIQALAVRIVEESENSKKYTDYTEREVDGVVKASHKGYDCENGKHNYADGVENFCCHIVVV